MSMLGVCGGGGSGGGGGMFGSGTRKKLKN